jgi:hypothetical protein
LDYAEAYKWHSLAAGGGNRQSEGAVKELLKIMTAAQVHEGQTRMALWLGQRRGESARMEGSK